VLGQHLDMAGLRYTVVGVTPKGFTGPDLNRTDVWLPMSTYPGGTIGVRPWYAHWRGGFIVRLIERPVDASVTDAWLSSVGTIALRQGEEANVPTHPDTATLLAGPLLETLGPALQPRIEEVITTRVMAVTFLVLLIACANVANLLLLRTLRRRGEIAIRLALGVSRVRLLLQLLTESLLLSLIAGIAALGVAAWLGGMLRRMLLPDVHLAGGALGARLLTVAILLAIGVGCLSALLPAMRTSRPDLTDALNSGIRESGGRHSRMRTTLLVVQVGFSVVLLAGAGMFVHSLHAVLSINVGYDRDRLVYGMVRFRNPVDRRVTYYPENRDALTVGLTNTAARLEKEPGVEHVALSTAPPMGGWGMTGVFFANGRKVPRLENRDPAIIWVTASYFAAAGLELTRGRFFTEIEASSPVVVINETAARTYWPGQDALGKCLVIGPGSAPCSTVVGVAKDTHLKAFLETPNAELLAPTKKPLVLVARAQGGEAERVTKEMRADLRLAFPNAELPYITTVAAAHEPELRPWRLGATLFSAFGVVALVVASIGTYSVVSFTISQRLHEIGIRIAIGARTRDILRAVMGDAIRPIMYGLAIGIALTLLLSRAVELILFDTSPRDPIILGLVSLLLVGAGLLASAIPVARATRVDPVTVLRAE